MSYKFNPFTSNFDLSSDSINFSFKKITSPINIESSQQMKLRCSIAVAAELRIKGQVIISSKDATYPRDITASEIFLLNKPSLHESLSIQGVAKIKSELRIFKASDFFTLINPIEGLFRVRRKRYYFAKSIVINEILKVHGTLNIGA